MSHRTNVLPCPRSCVALALATVLAAASACDPDEGEPAGDGTTTSADSAEDGGTDGGQDMGPATNGDGPADTSADGPPPGDDSDDGTAGDDTAGEDTPDDDATDDDTAGDDSGGQSGPPRVATLSVYLQDASERAAALDPQASLVQIAAFGIRSDGTINLEGDTGFVRRWTLGFQRPDGTDFRYDFMPDNGLSEDFPYLEDPTGSIVAELPIELEVLDSDVVVAAFEEQCGVTLTDNDQDVMTILYNEEYAAVQYGIGLADGGGWLTIDQGGMLVPLVEGTNPCF